MLIKFLLADILNFHSQLENKSAGVRDLGLIDGNKRAAIHSMMVYLLLNGYDLIADEDEIFEVAMKLADGKFSSAELSKWLKLKTATIDSNEIF